MKKLNLGIKSVPECDLVGISCHIPDYRAVFFLNKALNINLARAGNFSPNNDKTEEEKVQHSFYYWIDNEYNATICCVSNISKNHIMFPPLKNFDLLIVIFQDSQRYNTSLLVEKIRKIPNVILANTIDKSKIKGLTDLITQFDIHLTKIIAGEKKSLPKKSKDNNTNTTT